MEADREGRRRSARSLSIRGDGGCNRARSGAALLEDAVERASNRQALQVESRQGDRSGRGGEGQSRIGGLNGGARGHIGRT